MASNDLEGLRRKEEEGGRERWQKVKERRSILWAIEWRAEVGQRIQNPVLVPPWLLNGFAQETGVYA